jgi:hypothetical protein
MTKTLEQIQKENRKFILEAIHGCSYEEALKKELGFNCEVLAGVWGSPQIHRIDNLICYFDGDYLRFRELVGDIRKRDLTDEGLERLEECESARHRIIEIIGKPLTLSRVLLALPKINKENKTLDFLIGERGWEEIGGKWFDGYKKCFIARVETIFSCDCCENFFSDVFVWDLELETLEEQSEETQREINKIFTGE